MTTVLGVTTPPVVRMTGVERVYDGSPPFHALRQVDLTIHRGDYVAIVGPSGSGKSTLLNLIGLLDRPTRGDYHLDGVDVATVSDAERSRLRARSIGFVFQAFHLISNRSAVENVELAMLYRGTPRRERRALAVQALHDVGLGERLTAVPSSMSGGERQRVAVARAIVNRPSLLLCDEPTGNLDRANTRKVMELLENLHRAGHTLLVITHDSSVARGAPRVIQIEDGEMSEGVRDQA